MEAKKHKSYIDILRLIAIFWVYYTHTGTRSAYHYQIEGGPVSFWISFALQVFMLCGPSIFFAVSGGLLLNRNECIKDVLKKRILKYVLIILIFNLFQIYYNALFSPEFFENSFGSVLKMIYGNTLVTQYWFLNYYLVFLLLLPILRAAAQNMPTSAFYYIFGTYLLIELILPILEYFLGMNRIALDFGTLSFIMITPLAGYFIENRLSELTAKKLIIINFVGIGSFILNFWFSYYTASRIIEERNLLGASVILALVIYIDVKKVFENRNLKNISVKILKIMGDGVFLAFLIENQMKDLYVGLYDSTVNHISWLGATLLWLIPGILTAILIRFILSLIPGVKKIIP